MSWSYGKHNSPPADLKKYLDEDAVKMIAHVQGVERSIADQALGLVRAVVEANASSSVIDLSANGSATIDRDGNQSNQNLNIKVSAH
jgi:hypothetical protein